jgi:3',5'-cyclic AMP phosphodiesterase CpdA
VFVHTEAVTQTRARAGVLLLVLAAALGLAYASGLWRSEEPVPSDVAGQQVPPVKEAPLVRLAVAGDTGTGDAAQAATVDAMVDQARGRPPYDALVLLGDLVYEDGDADEVDTAVIEPFEPLTSQGTELVPVLGNHDHESGEGAEILAELGREEPWYVERVGPVRIVVLDSEHADDPDQRRWLEQVLAQPRPAGEWTIAAMHHPAYSAGHHGSTAEVQENWVPLLTRHDVPLVLAGHDHDYQRSLPLDGVTYVVSGGAAKLRPTGREDFTAVSASVLHYLDLLVYPRHITGRAIDQAGKLVDQFTIRR